MKKKQRITAACLYFLTSIDNTSMKLSCSFQGAIILEIKISGHDTIT